MLLWLCSLAGAASALGPCTHPAAVVAGDRRRRHPSASARQELETKLAAFEQATGGQLAVLIVKTAEPETIEQYAIRVGDAWKVGKKGSGTTAPSCWSQ